MRKILMPMQEKDIDFGKRMCYNKIGKQIRPRKLHTIPKKIKENKNDTDTEK